MRSVAPLLIFAALLLPASAPISAWASGYSSPRGEARSIVGASTASPSAIAAPSPGRLVVTVSGTWGRRPVGLAGVRLVVRGTVAPYANGQRVIVRFFRDRRKVAVRALRLLPSRGGRAGSFQLSYTSARTGVLVIRAVHPATPQLGALSATTRPVRLLRPDLRSGARGPVVRALQFALASLHYSVSTSGFFDDATSRAVIAYRKLTREALAPDADARLFTLLQRGTGSFHVRYPRDGRHIEADLSHQVLAEINPGGHVRRIYTTSSGKPSTPTVVGRFRVYSKTFGVNAKGMVDSSYFAGGYAIHGYPDVPYYPASHGCLRIALPDAASVYSWLSIGVPVDVYYAGGGGSHQLNAGAGP